MCMLHFTTDRTVVSFIMSMAIDQTQHFIAYTTSKVFVAHLFTYVILQNNTSWAQGTEIPISLCIYNTLLTQYGSKNLKGCQLVVLEQFDEWEHQLWQVRGLPKHWSPVSQR